MLFLAAGAEFATAPQIASPAVRPGAFSDGWREAIATAGPTSLVRDDGVAPGRSFPARGEPWRPGTHSRCWSSTMTTRTPLMEELLAELVDVEAATVL